MSDSMLAIRRSAMRPGIELRQDYDAARLRALAKATHDAGQSRRLLALAEIYDGGTRTKAAQVGGVGLQTVRDWVVRFNAHGPEALIDGKAPGNACKLSARPRHHAKSDAAVAVFKKSFPRVWRKSRPTRPMASR